MIRNSSGTFSADVKLQLIIADKRYELGQLGPNFALIRDAQDIDATEGEIELTVDGKVSTSQVRFTSPISKDSRRFEFEAIG